MLTGSAISAWPAFVARRQAVSRRLWHVRSKQPISVNTPLAYAVKAARQCQDAFDICGQSGQAVSTRLWHVMQATLFVADSSGPFRALTISVELSPHVHLIMFNYRLQYLHECMCDIEQKNLTLILAHAETCKQRAKHL